MELICNSKTGRQTFKRDGGQVAMVQRQEEMGQEDKKTEKGTQIDPPG
jgi:hypothetical protein